MSTISSVSSGVSQRPDFSQMEQAMFKQADADGDGSINQDELNELISNNPRLAKAFSSLAASSNSAAPTAADVFKKLDTDGDGKVSATEFTAALQAARATMHAHGHHHAPPPPPADDSDSTSSTDEKTELKNLLEAFLSKLQQNGNDSDGTTSAPASTDATSSSTSATGSANDSDSDIKTLLAQILDKMKQQAAYAADGTQGSTSASSAAIFQVTA